MTFRRCVTLTVGISLSLLISRASAGSEDSMVVAEVAGDKLTRADLEQKEASNLLQARYQYYLAERTALDQLVDDHLLEIQARREHISVEQLFGREVTQKIKDPTEEQIEIFYEGMQSDKTYAEMRPEILKSIRQLRMTKARTAYLKSLRSQASIHIALTAPTAQVGPDDAPLRGPKNAPVVIVEFSDYECPYCQQIHPQLKQLQNEFNGKVALALKSFPLPMHPRAGKAAEAARCADAQGRFWDFHDVLFDNNKKLEVPQLKEYARALKLDGAAFDKCLDSGDQVAAVQKDVTQGLRLGLTGTPSFFINGHFFSGAVTYKTLHEFVEQQLALQAGTGGMTKSHPSAP
jgi:protein-disulfide isomerase